MKKKKISGYQETTVSKLLNGRLQINSGAFWNAKGDVKSEDYLIECKYTTNMSYSLSTRTWRKILHESVLEDKKPMIVLDFLNKKSHKTENRLAVVDFYDLKELIEFKKEHEKGDNNEA